MRLQGLDIARFLAFTGMVLVNFRIAAGVSTDGNIASILTYLLEGRAAALFVVLAGVGIGLAHPASLLLAKRGAFLLAMGLLNQIIFVADILHYYGVYFLAAIITLKLSPKGLLLTSGAVLIVSLIALVTMDYEAGWNWNTYEYANFWTPIGFMRNLFFNGWHPVFPWLTFLLFGMYLGQLPLSETRTQRRLMLVGVLSAIAIITLSSLLSQDPDLAEITGLSPIPPGPLYILAGIATSSAAIGTILLATPFLSRCGLTTLLAASGRQTLTLYVAHILIGMGILGAMGWLETGALSTSEILCFSLVFVAASAFYAWVWAKAFKRGPLETLMRHITG